MRRSVALFIFLIAASPGYAQNLPQPTGWVNDFAGVIDSATASNISSAIEEVEQKTSSEIAVVTVSSIAPYDEKAYARMLFDAWKPGKKGKDNGVLVLLAIKERRWRIETGYGMEGILPDGLCGEIGRNFMVPDFKAGNYGRGLYQGVRAIAGVIARDAHVSLSTQGPEAAVVSQRASSAHADTLDVGTIFFIFLIVGIIFLSNLGRWYGGRWYSSGSWGGGGFGGGGGGFGGFGGGGGGGGGAGGGF